MVGRLSDPVSWFVVVVEAVGARPKQWQRPVERQSLVPRRKRRVVVEHDAGCVDVVRVCRYVGSCREVVVQQARLHVEVIRVVELLEHVAVEEGTVERHVVCVQQFRPIWVDDVAKQTVVLGKLADDVRRKPEL